MTISRRDFGKLVFLGVSEATLLFADTWVARAQTVRAATNRSLINGVQFGLQPFCYHDLAMTPKTAAN